MDLLSYLSKNNISVAMFARQIGVHRTSIYRFTNGIQMPLPKTIQKITDVTNGQVTANDFLRERLASME